MITPGTILMDKDTLRPQRLQLEGDTYSNDWMSVKHNLTPNEFEKELRDNLEKMTALGVPRKNIRYFLPPVPLR